ncbi:hypothetical protein V6N13_017213 [Hibiscus sabdariffa]|uniref:RRM domain-containing protein n=1 Tax=Hibiscus sabdariffa TaxID=183260 RepID=A0ABR2CZA0_9ROSI
MAVPHRRSDTRENSSTIGVRTTVHHTRIGVPVFVNFVSKRIHSSTLREAFAGYGTVLDIYIAYNNPSRFNKKYTFAFVRFSSREEAAKAVELGNMRKMDGFTIKVFWARSQQMIRRGTIVNANSNRLTNSKSEFYKFTNGRSYREVLLAKGITRQQTSIEQEFIDVDATNSNKEPVVKPKFEPFHFSLP